VAEATSQEPTLVVGPLALVALAGLRRGFARHEPLFVLVGVAAAAAEVGWSDYRRFKRRWTVLSYYRDS
jgi:hypothetical protein